MAARSVQFVAEPPSPCTYTAGSLPAAPGVRRTKTELPSTGTASPGHAGAVKSGAGSGASDSRAAGGRLAVTAPNGTTPPDARQSAARRHPPAVACGPRGGYAAPGAAGRAHPGAG